MDVQQLVRARVATGELEAPAELVAGIDDGSIQLVEVVKALGEYLISTEEVRLHALMFLGDVIKRVKPSRINRPATATLTRFFLSSLDDFTALPSSLNALIVLANLSTFDSPTALEVFAAVCSQVNMKSYAQAVRHQVYTLFDALLARHRPALLELGDDFIRSYISMVDGEKDPRNLLLLFAMDRVILLEFNIENFVEDLFDVTFCYFPISFRPPPNDPYGITADDLKNALRACLCATPYFAKLALPLFLEKFASATGPAMDLMLSMAACFPTYGAVAVGERGEELWECIKTEVLYQSDKSIEETALTALESLIRTLYPTAADVPSGLAQTIIKECLALLQEPDKSTSLGAAKLLVGLLNASPSVGKFAISQAIPQLVRQFNSPATPAHRIPILWTITSLLIAASKIYAAPSTDGASTSTSTTTSTAVARRYEAERVFDNYREPLWDTLREGLRTDGLKEAASRGCVAIIEIPGMWGRGEVEEVVKSIGEIVLRDDSADVRGAAVKGLISISKLHPAIIENTTLPPLFHSLPDRAPSIDNAKARTTYRATLRAIAELCAAPALFETLSIRVPNKLDALAQAVEADAGAGGEDQYECVVAYAYDIVACLDETVRHKTADKHVDVAKHFGAVVPRLWRLAVRAAQDQGAGGGAAQVWRDRRVLGVVGKVTGRWFWELDASKQAPVFAAAQALFERGDGAFVGLDQAEMGRGSPLRNGASKAEQNLVGLYSALVQFLRPDTALPFAPAAYLAQMVHWTIHVASDAHGVGAALELLTAFVNQRAGTEGMQQVLQGLLEQLWVGDVQDTNKDGEVRRRGLMVYLYITRALALLRDPLAYTAVERVLDVLKLAYFDPAIVGEAARGLEVVALGKGRGSGLGARGKGKGKGKGEESHLTAKLLWAQKMWNFALPRIVAGDSEAKERLVYLAAFASLLPLVPSSLLISDLSNLLPLILRCFSLSVPQERLNAITTLESILETPDLASEADKVLHRHAEGVVEGLLKSVVVDKGQEAGAGMASNGAVRSAALRALAAIPPIIRFETLGRLKSDVLRAIGLALDDPLRSVRVEAVECRAVWYSYK